MTATLGDVTSRKWKPEPTAEQLAAEELVNFGDAGPRARRALYVVPPSAHSYRLRCRRVDVCAREAAERCHARDALRGPCCNPGRTPLRGPRGKARAAGRVAQPGLGALRL